MIVNERVRRVREYKQLGTQELARQAGLSAAAISRLERQPRMPRIDTLQKIAAALDVSVSFLVGEKRAEAGLHVALAQESLELFLRDQKMGKDEEDVLMRISLESSAPVSRDDWAKLRLNLAISRSHAR